MHVGVSCAAFNIWTYVIGSNVFVCRRHSTRRTKAEAVREATVEAELAEVDCPISETTANRLEEVAEVGPVRRIPPVVNRPSVADDTRNHLVPSSTQTRTACSIGWPFWPCGSFTICGRSSSVWPSPNCTRTRICSPGTSATPWEMPPTPWTSPSSSGPATWSKESWSTTAANWPSTTFAQRPS